MELVSIIAYGVSAFAWGFCVSHGIWLKIDKDQVDLHKREIEYYKSQIK